MKEHQKAVSTLRADSFVIDSYHRHVCDMCVRNMTDTIPGCRDQQTLLLFSHSKNFWKRAHYFIKVYI